MKTSWFTIFYTQIVQHPSFADAVSFARESNLLDDRLKNEGCGVYRLGKVKILKESAFEEAVEWFQANKKQIIKEELERLDFFR